jgi:hypothetical protein
MLWGGGPKSTGGNNVWRLDIQSKTRAAPLSAVCVEFISRKPIGCRWREAEINDVMHMVTTLAVEGGIAQL